MPNRSDYSDLPPEIRELAEGLEDVWAQIGALDLPAQPATDDSPDPWLPQGRRPPGIGDLPPEPTLDEQFRRMKRRWRDRQRSKKAYDQNAHIRSMAIEIGEVAPGVEYWVVETTMKKESERMRADEASGKLPAGFCDRMSFTMSMADALNGYVAFPKRKAPLRTRSLLNRKGEESEGDRRILSYIPVHGGITYAVKDQTACVYGFDTCHFNSEFMPRSDPRWIQWQCRVLYQGLMKAAEIEDEYLRARTNEAKARILQPLVDLVPEEEPGFGMMLNILSGEL